MTTGSSCWLPTLRFFNNLYRQYGNRVVSGKAAYNWVIIGNPELFKRTTVAIKLKRVYEKYENSDGQRVLVERLWPSGLSKENARVDIWLKDTAPSTELRKWFNHDPAKWKEFKERYFAELDCNPQVLKPILKIPGKETITFVFASKDETYNNSAALREYLEKRHNI